VDVLAPIVICAQVALLDEVVELTPTMVFIKRVFALSRMWVNQNAIVSESRMVWHHQQHQCFASISIVTNLVVLRMRRGNHLIPFEMVMNDGLPSSHPNATK